MSPAIALVRDRAHGPEETVRRSAAGIARGGTRVLEGIAPTSVAAIDQGEIVPILEAAIAPVETVLEVTVLVVIGLISAVGIVPAATDPT